jgi:hypothetical protein
MRQSRMSGSVRGRGERSPRSTRPPRVEEVGRVGTLYTIAAIQQQVCTGSARSTGWFRRLATRRPDP